MTPSTPKFIFFGTPYVGRDTLAHLVENGYVPSLVVTSPDAPSGRGHVLTACETKEWALLHNLPIITPQKITKEVIAELDSCGTEYALVVAYGKILPQSLIDIFPKGILNVHYSLLPKYRGASPVESALLHGDTLTGVSIQKMVKELDAGDVLEEEEVSILPLDTTRELRPRLVQIGAELLVTTLPLFLSGEAFYTPQEPAFISRTHKIKKEDGELILSGDALQNWNTYRAYAESPGTYFFMERGGKRIRVKIKTATYNGKEFTPLRVVPEGKQEMDFNALS
jgi:methionyl-tRNA formyltransferase